MLSSLLAIIVPTFGIVGVGWLCRRTGVWDRASVHVLNRYAYVVALPALIFDAVFRQITTSVVRVGDLRYLAGLLLGHLAVFGISVAITRASRHREVRATGPMLLVFGSTAYLGIPYATYAFGPTGTAYAAFGSIALVVVILGVSLAVLNAHGRRETPTATLHQLLELPFLWVTLTGILLPLLGIRNLPLAITRTIDILAGSAGPTALLALGAFQFDLRLDRIPWRSAIPLGIGKIVLPALVTYGALRLLGVTGIPLAVGTSLGATSVAITAFVLADEYRVGRELTAGALVASTPASLAALTTITALWIGAEVFQ